MDGLTLQLTLFDAVRMVWAMAFGACVGSLINVLAYRIPKGLDYVTPTSRCPNCSTKLTWRENIPIFGWLFLAGKCRFCRSPISAEYPIVETVVAVLWGAAFMACYSDPSTPLHDVFSWMEPEWARGGFVQTWPIFLVVVALLSSLVAMTLVDAKTYTIPAELTNFPTIVGLVVHPAWALYIFFSQGKLTGSAPGYDWAIWTPDKFGWWWVGAALGGGVGWGLANLLLRFKVLRQSYEGYAAWEQEELAKLEAARAGGEDVRSNAGEGEAPINELMPQVQEDGNAAGAETTSEQDMWLAYPHARRDMLRELLFVGVIASVAAVGGLVAHWWAGPWVMNANTLRMEPISDAGVPLWLSVLSGALLGYLIGGGVVWAMRIIGSLAFGKEALGLGDVHMMAAVGACLGFVDPTIAFFGAAFLGMAGWAIQLLFQGKNQRMLPYGPFLALATVLVWFGKPGLEKFAGWALDGRVNLP